MRVRSASDLCLGDTDLESLLPLIKIEEVRSRATVVGNPAIGVDQVEALRSGTVSFVYHVIHLFDEDGQSDVQVQTTGLSHFLTLIKALVLPE